MNYQGAIRHADSTANLQLWLEAESDPKQQFKMIDAWLRAMEKYAETMKAAHIAQETFTGGRVN